MDLFNFFLLYTKQTNSRIQPQYLKSLKTSKSISSVLKKKKTEKKLVVIIRLLARADTILNGLAVNR